jgi:hypothetical protein
LSNGNGNFESASKYRGPQANIFRERSEIIQQFTIFDIINRLFMLSDMHDGNYGIIKKLDNSISVKIVDFNAPTQAYALNETTFFHPFLRANGGLYKKNNEIAKIILDHGNKGNKLKEGMTALEFINREKLAQALTDAKNEVITFILDNENISGKQNAEVLGIDHVDPNNLESNSAVEDLFIYLRTVLDNYDVAFQCFLANQEPLE